MKKALITGITGQDGSYLAEFLLNQGYEVHGVVRRSSSAGTQRIDSLLEDGKGLFLHYGDLSDTGSISRLVDRTAPDEIYNLGAQSNVKISFDIPEYTADIDALGAVRLLESINDINPLIRYYQASSGEMFGKAREFPQNENTPFCPRSPYAAAKLYAYWITVNYREAYHLFACNGILFSHESPRRSENFVTRKITKGIARILKGEQEKLTLGNLDARRDWGFAEDYVEAMWLILQQREPEDFVISTGETHSVREFCTLAFRCAGMELEWVGKGLEEKGIDQKTGRELVDVSSRYFRPCEVNLLLGDSSKAREKLKWAPNVSFEQLVDLMVESDRKAAGV